MGRLSRGDIEFDTGRAASWALRSAPPRELGPQAGTRSAFRISASSRRTARGGQGRLTFPL